jgi:HD-GYP domain-containing protein (c-di-GMP phosphodiesterase class II)
MAVSQERLETQEMTLESELEQLSDQIERTYEEITLLHSLARNLQISRSPAEVAEICLCRMQASLNSRGNVIWIESETGPSRFLTEGDVPFDEEGMQRLVARYAARQWFHPLVKNNIEHTPLGEEFPGLKNLVLAPISEGLHRNGWILVCNSPQGEEFGTVEASLLNSIATILGTHVRNIDLYHQHDELLLSFVRSLVQTLDAKDAYTRGHSDRVALIARRLGQQMGLSEDELYDVYLSGLLHDIGKIGVDDRILGKPGKLTDEEFAEIKKHPLIGYEILKGLKNLQKVLPGVRSHHEAFDGSGYPDGLRGESIPLMARLLAVADSYDAMGSNRPYRQGMPLEKIEAIFRAGAGKQWDAAIIDAYFAARLDVQQICASYSPDEGDLL